MGRRSLQPVRSSDWSPAHARHLLNRAGFGVPEERVAHLAALSPRSAVAGIVQYQDIPDVLAPPDFLLDRADYQEYRAAMRDVASDDDRRRVARELRARERAAIQRLQGWWFERMVRTNRPLKEKLALFWHGHFAVSAQKVPISAFNYQLNDLFRQHATGNVKALTIAVAQSPAMLRYLDNIQNVKGSPNENWARELMELFTMGVGHYTEHDVKEAARAFTGWTVDEAEFAFDLRRHDLGIKTFLGRRGNFDGWDIINIIFDQPATAEFIAEKLWAFFAYENPERDIVEGLARTLREHGYDLAPMLEQIFLSQAFYSDNAVGSQIKSPVQYLVQLVHHLEMDDPPYLALARASAQLGQALFYPPNVAGWDGGRAWINANTLLMRYNLPKSIVVAGLVEPDEMTMMDMRGMRQNTMRQYREEFRSAMQNLPRSQQRDIRQRLQDATSREERRTIVENTVFTAHSGEAWDVRAIFRGLEFATVGECVDALAARHLSVPLNREQRAILAEALSPAGDLNARLSPSGLTTQQMTSVMHLVFSLAEYQLC